MWYHDGLFWYQKPPNAGKHMETNTFNARLPRELCEFLDSQAKKRGWSRNQLIVNRLEAWRRSIELTKRKRKRAKR